MEKKDANLPSNFDDFLQVFRDLLNTKVLNGKFAFRKYTFQEGHLKDVEISLQKDSTGTVYFSFSRFQQGTINFTGIQDNTRIQVTINENQWIIGLLLRSIELSGVIDVLNTLQVDNRSRIQVVRKKVREKVP